jgi:hypothetical protein
VTAPAKAKSKIELIGDERPLMDAAHVIDLFEDAAHLNETGSEREGATETLGAEGHVLMTGDLHDHRKNYRRFLKLAELDNSIDNHLIIHEVIHGKNVIKGCDTSVLMLAREAALKIKYPEQVHIMLSNHELAQVNGEAVLRDGEPMSVMFHEAVDRIYKDDAEHVRDAMTRFVYSMAAAVKTENGILCCHSLPSPDQIDDFDDQAIFRKPTFDDLEPGGDIHNLVWGRGHDEHVSLFLRHSWDARVIIVGHEQAPDGYKLIGDGTLILASDHDSGVVLPIDLSEIPSMDRLVEQIVPLMSVDV